MSPVRRSGSAARPQPEVLRGSLFTLRRRCGTPTCRCADGEGHASPALAYPAGGRTKTLTLTEQEAVEVAAALARYAQAKADLDEQAAAGLTALLARVAARRASRSSPSRSRRSSRQRWRRSPPPVNSSRRRWVGCKAARRAAWSTPSWRRGCRPTPGKCSVRCSRTIWTCARLGSSGSRRWPTPTRSPTRRVGQRGAGVPFTVRAATGRCPAPAPQGEQAAAQHLGLRTGSRTGTTYGRHGLLQPVGGLPTG